MVSKRPEPTVGVISTLDVENVWRKYRLPIESQIDTWNQSYQNIFFFYSLLDMSLSCFSLSFLSTLTQPFSNFHERERKNPSSKRGSNIFENFNYILYSICSGIVFDSMTLVGDNLSKFGSIDWIHWMILAICVDESERERERGKKEFLSNGVKLKSTLYKVWLKCLSFHSLDVKYAVV